MRKIGCQKFQMNRNNKILNGTWENTYTIIGEPEQKELIEINDGKYYILNNYGNREEVFYIEDFYHNPNTTTIFFVKELTHELKDIRDKSEHYNINRLRKKTDDLLVGYENGTTKIQYKRMSN